MVKYSDEQILELVKDRFSGKKVYFLAPIVKGRKGHYKELFEQLRRKGFSMCGLIMRSGSLHQE